MTGVNARESQGRLVAARFMITGSGHQHGVTPAILVRARPREPSYRYTTDSADGRASARSPLSSARRREAAPSRHFDRTPRRDLA